MLINHLSADEKEEEKIEEDEDVDSHIDLLLAKMAKVRWKRNSSSSSSDLSSDGKD